MLGRSAFRMTTRRLISVGAKSPAVDVVLDFPRATAKFSELVAGKKVVLVGLPGAFTPT